MRPFKPGAALVAAACGYEFAAITTARFPTITALTRARHPHVRVAALAAFTAWIWSHMLRPDL